MPLPDNPPAQPAMTARQRRDARLKDFLEADRQQRIAYRQGVERRLAEGAVKTPTERESLASIAADLRVIRAALKL